MQFDLLSARRFDRPDGTVVFSVAEADPSRVVRLFRPGHPDYEAAAEMHKAALAEQAYAHPEATAGEPA